MTDDKAERPRIPPNQVVTSKFPVMTAGTPVTAAETDWTLTLEGDVEYPLVLGWRDFNKLPKRDFTVDIHCVTRWSKLDTRWTGVDVQTLVDLVRPLPGSAYVLAKADGNYSANLRIADLLDGQAFVATHYDGRPLPEQHGGPARLVVPKLYFWKSAKWLRGLQFGPYDHKGYWEKLGYHNYGDPWLEQRYR